MVNAGALSIEYFFQLEIHCHANHSDCLYMELQMILTRSIAFDIFIQTHTSHTFSDLVMIIQLMGLGKSFVNV